MDEPAQELVVLREHGTVPQSPAEARLANVIYDELTNLAMGRGLYLGGSAICPDDGRHVIAVSGALDLIALARRMLQGVPRLAPRGEVAQATKTQPPMPPAMPHNAYLPPGGPASQLP